MKIFSFIYNKDKLAEELKSIEKAQKILDERLEKKQVSSETYKQKSLEFMLKREKLEKKFNRVDK